MFCCRRTASFSPTHELDSAIGRKHRASATRSVISTQPEPSPAGKLGTSEEAASKDEDEAKPSETDITLMVNKEDAPSNDLDQSKSRVSKGRRGYRAPKVDATIEIPSFPKSDQIKEEIRCAILNNQFLHDLIPGHIIDKVIDAMAPCDVSAGDIIVQQGEIGEKFFVNEAGTFQIVVNKEIFKEFDTATVFGELAVLYNQRRAATVKAATAGKIWMIDGSVYKALMIKDARFQEEQRLAFLRGVKLLKDSSIDKLRQIAKLLKQNFYASNTAIVKQGDVGDKFYIIKTGKVKIVKNGDVVANISDGDYFGEKALIEADVRQATCIAEAPGVTCLELSRQEFIDYLGDFDKFIAAETEAAEVEIRKSNAKLTKGDFPAVNQLEKICTIGEGGFGRVMLVKIPDTMRYYALKMLPKVDNNSLEQQQHIKNEKTIHEVCNSVFIVQLHKTYVDDRYLYFLMEPCMGGDLFSYMQRQKYRRFEEPQARFIAACILEALAYLHAKDFIYRDLKPENMLIDANGYIKLADFGFAKQCKPGDNTYTFAGTPEYVAPEVIYGKGHNRAIDYWGFGIFIFELLVGKTPFKSNDPSYMVTYGLILKGIDNIMFPKQMGKNSSHLIKRLCRLTPHERLGCQNGGVEDIRKHKWFQAFKWTDLHERKIASELKPKLTGPSDTNNFDDYDEEYPEPKADYSDTWKYFDS